MNSIKHDLLLKNNKKYKTLPTNCKNISNNVFKSIQNQHYILKRFILNKYIHNYKILKEFF
jgi:hypothetical protein